MKRLAIALAILALLAASPASALRKPIPSKRPSTRDLLRKCVAGNQTACTKLFRILNK